VTLLGKLGIVEARLRCLEIGAAILLVGIEEERIEPPVEIVMARDIVLGTAWRIELPDMSYQITQPPLQLGPARQYFRLIHQDRQRIRDRAILDHEGSLHVQFAERQFGVEQHPAFGVGGEETHRNRLAGAIATAELRPARSRKRHRPAANELRQEITQ
jgi:hypothetical protein